MKNVATDEFKVKIMDSFDSKKDFKTLADEIIYKPMRENVKIYDIEVLGLEPTEYNDVTKSLYGTSDKIILEQISLGELIPFKLSFKMKLNNSYLSSVKSFLEKSSESIDEDPSVIDIRDMNSIAFGKIPASLKNPSSYRNDTLKRNFELTKVYKLSSANGNIMKALSSNQKLTPIVSIKLLDESNEKIKRYVYTYYSTHFAECKSAFVGCSQVSDNTAISSKMLYVSDNINVGYDYYDMEFLVGLPLKLRDESNLFSVNEFPINALLFLTKDEASKVKNIKIEVKMGPKR